jgi:hypothetical protein
MPKFRLFHLRIGNGPGRVHDAVFTAMMNGDVGEAVALGLYDEVALIKAPKIQNIYHLTNSVERHWSQNSEIEACAPRCRSTIVGDLVLDEDGVLHSCARIGWEAVPDDVRDMFMLDLGARVSLLEPAAALQPGFPD